VQISHLLALPAADLERQEHPPIHLGMVEIRNDHDMYTIIEASFRIEQLCWGLVPPGTMGHQL
jgi:hypothetical protein